MKRSSLIARLIFTIGLTASSIVNAAAPSVPPAVLAQLQGMPLSEQRALARQYGFNLEQVIGANPRTAGENERRASLGARAEPLETLEQARYRELGLDGLADGEMVLEEDAETDQELKRFGAEIFDPKISTFAPVDNIPVPEGYRLGIGDELNLMLVGKEPGDYPLLIDRDGSVTLPKLGRINLTGLTFPEAKTLIESRVGQQMIGSEAILSMGSMRSINVFMAGEVSNPGNYSVSALSTLSQVIFVAGGISEVGSYRGVMLKRNGETIQTFDIYDLLLYGDNSNDMRLQSGDVVFVPISGAQIAISGEVPRPAIYELKTDDTIGKAVEMAGGLLARSYPRQVLLNRYEAVDALPTISTLNLQDPATLEMLAMDGDELRIRAVSTRASNPIAIEGPVETDNVIGWRKGLKIADVFTSIEGDLKPIADLNLSMIVRRKNTLNDITVLPFSLSKAIIDDSPNDNLLLQPFDKIVILPLPSVDEDEFEAFNNDAVESDSEVAGEYRSSVAEENTNLPTQKDEQELRRAIIDPIVQKLKQQARSGERAQVVSISGSVQQPGEYPLLGDGSIDDVVALAGGYTDEAYLKQVEIRRIIVDETQEAKIEFLNLDLTEARSSSFQLRGRDSLRINQIPNWSTDEIVELKGEFIFPGMYTISQGETISSLIDRAGGFTDDAFLRGAQYFSATAREAQIQQLRKIAASKERRLASRRVAGELSDDYVADDSDDDKVAFVNEDLLGRVVIDIERIIRGDTSADVVVESGDSISVPKFSNTIGVVGEVYEPGTYSFTPGLLLDDYVNVAGGETIFALRKNIYLLKADGTVRYASGGFLKGLTSFDKQGSTLSVSPGDVVVVPTNLDYDRPLERITGVTNVVFQSLTSIAAFLSITK